VNSLTRRRDATLSIPVMACPRWRAIQTRSRQEKAAVKRLEIRGVTTVLPLLTEMHRKSDRRKVVELPLFSSYVFVQLITTGESRGSVPHAKRLPICRASHGGYIYPGRADPGRSESTYVERSIGKPSFPQGGSGCESVEAFSMALRAYSCRARQTSHPLLQCRDLWQFVSRATILIFSTPFVPVLTPAQLKSAPS
jgi:hypothetical protein